MEGTTALEACFGPLLARRARRRRLRLQLAPSLVRGAFTRTGADPPRPLGASNLALPKLST
jgi:hypothetical protein